MMMQTAPRAPLKMIEAQVVLQMPEQFLDAPKTDFGLAISLIGRKKTQVEHCKAGTKIFRAGIRFTGNDPVIRQLLQTKRFKQLKCKLHLGDNGSAALWHLTFRQPFLVFLPSSRQIKAERQRTMFLNVPKEITPFDKLHDQERAACMLASIVGRDDVRVDEFCRRTDFLLKPS